MALPGDISALTAVLQGAGFVAADEEAVELLSSAGDDLELLQSLLERRLSGEPLAWITGFTSFCNLSIRVDRGVYVPRWQSEPLARRAGERLAPKGIAIEVCAGSGAIAKLLATERPSAHVLAFDIDHRAVACARANGIDANVGDLFDSVPPGLAGRVDVVVGVVPYVPTAALSLLARDTFRFESKLCYDGGRDGTDLLRRVALESTAYLCRGGALLLELGADQGDELSDALGRLGFVDVFVHFDEEGDERGIEATFAGPDQCRKADNASRVP